MFKSGDKVRIIDTTDSFAGFHRGDTGTVDKAWAGCHHDMLDITWDKERAGIPNGNYFAYRFELVKNPDFVGQIDSVLETLGDLIRKNTPARGQFLLLNAYWTLHKDSLSEH